MSPSTVAIISAALKADSSLSAQDRARVLNAVKNPAPVPAAIPQDGPRVFTRGELAKRFGRSVRFIDKLAKSGLLERIKLPGRVRGCGFRVEDVQALLNPA